MFSHTHVAFIVQCVWTLLAFYCCAARSRRTTVTMRCFIYRKWIFSRLRRSLNDGSTIWADLWHFGAQRRNKSSSSSKWVRSSIKFVRLVSGWTIAIHYKFYPYNLTGQKLNWKSSIKIKLLKKWNNLKFWKYVKKNIL